MTHNPKTVPTKVALVDLDGQPVPNQVLETIAREGIELTVRDCKTREELAEVADDADVIWLFGGSRILLNGNLDVAARAVARTMCPSTRQAVAVSSLPIRRRHSATPCPIIPSACYSTLCAASPRSIAAFASAGGNPLRQIR
jgi:hypothetical protein